MTRRTRRWGRMLTIAVAGLAGGLVLAAPAAAHVTVNPKQADPGSYARVAFRVPTESDTASTTKLQVYLPTGTPIGSVSVMPVTGWTATVHHKKLDKPLKGEGGDITKVVSDITWKADKAAAIKPGQFQEFPVSLGPLPKSGSLTFKALQTYSDGSVVRWIQSSTGDTEPEHPAPVLTIGASAAPSTTAEAATGAHAADSGDSDGSAGTALTVAIIGLIVGALGLVLGGLAYLRSHRA